MNVGYFSRANVASWNQVKPATHRLRQMGTWMLDLFSTSVERPTSKPAYNPRFAAKTKHGNYNAWLAQIAQSGIHYDILAGVDTDQVPLKMFLNRLLGYFNDPDVAFAVGPQVYGNGVQGLAGLVVRWAESQASFFQSTIQRAGNASSSAMFVGTNYAVRMDALKQIGGFYPCITEDMATGLAIHASRNPKTGNRWRSVYTPDVLAIGEGPAFWGPYFTQQWRWAAGSFDTWKKLVWKSIYKLSPRATFHYLLVLLFYPVAACTWLLAIVSSALYLTTGATAVDAPWGQFVSLYLMAVVLQISLYFWNRRYNVSPHETAGSYGVAGMALTSLVAPIYFSALLGVIFGRKTSFVVTTKGSAVNPDHLGTFKSHILWAGIGAGLGAFGIMHGRHHPALLIWTGMLLIICLMPLVLGMIQIIHDRPVVLPRPQLLGSGETTNA
jgi:cellulose synthase/poly-beta-1,6-N-acetylglucosamine synthase-like glycosyltransferase